MTTVIQEIISASKPGKPLVWCAPDGSSHSHARAEILTQARICAWNLRRLGIGPGQVVAVMLPQGFDLMRAWLGLLVLGAVPTILPPPNPRQHPSLWEANLRHIVRYTRARALIHAPSFEEKLTLLGVDGIPDFESISSHWLTAGDSLLDPHSSAADQLVLLQHSSGTTGLQKGVALNSRTILRQVELYSRAIQLDPDRDRIVSWLPLYHDMGLVACLLVPLLTGTELVFMDNFAWALQPSMLLEAVSRHRPTLCWMPNFAFSFLADRVTRAQKQHLELDSVRMWINCSEPVRKESFDRFAAAFRDQGVVRSSLASCYAMAENTFAVTQSVPGASPPTLPFRADLGCAAPRAPSSPAGEVTQLVSSGTPLSEHRLRILDDEGCQLDDGRLGEIHIASPCLMQGYHQRADLSREAICDGWYATGDLGLRYQGQLYVCGRKKDLIIVAGRNIFPEDVEKLLDDIDHVQPGRTVAFGIYAPQEGTEQLVVLAEWRHARPPEAREMRQTRRAIVQAIGQQLGVRVGDTRLLPPGSLLKSSSGKISRERCRQLYLDTLQSRN